MGEKRSLGRELGFVVAIDGEVELGGVHAREGQEEEEDDDGSEEAQE